jgi:hypothetical protein
MAIRGSRIPPADFRTTTYRMVGFNMAPEFPAVRRPLCTPARSADSITEASHMHSLPVEARVSAAASMVVAGFMAEEVGTDEYDAGDVGKSTQEKQDSE